MNQDTHSILILTGSYGHGHNTAARNLEKAFLSRVPEGVRVEVLDFFSHAFPRISNVLQRGYGFAINHLPGLWRQFYKMADTNAVGLFSSSVVHRKLAEEIRRRQPVAVVSTFPAYGLLIQQLFGPPSERPFRFYTVITDAISINAIWCRGQSDLVFVTDDDSKEVVRQHGVPESRLRAYGFPLASLGSTETEPLPPPNRIRPRLLYLPTTKTAHVRQTLALLGAFCRQTPTELTLVLGRHERRLKGAVDKLRKTLPEDQLIVHGWREDVPALMARHHVVLTKAGGATISEALGAECPPLINYVVPGQEEGNAELVRRLGCGLRIDSAAELPATLTRMLCADEAAWWHQARERLRGLDRAAASRRIVEAVLEQTELVETGAPA